MSVRRQQCLISGKRAGDMKLVQSYTREHEMYGRCVISPVNDARCTCYHVMDRAYTDNDVRFSLQSASVTGHGPRAPSPLRTRD